MCGAASSSCRSLNSINTCTDTHSSVPPLLRPSLCLFSHAHFLSLPQSICLDHCSSLYHSITLLSPCLLLCPKGGTFYIFSAYPYFSAVTEFLSLDHHGSLSLCAQSISGAWVGRLHQRARERERAPNYVSTLDLCVSQLFRCTTVKCHWSISHTLCLHALQQHTPVSITTKPFCANTYWWGACQQKIWKTRPQRPREWRLCGLRQTKPNAVAQTGVTWIKTRLVEARVNNECERVNIQYIRAQEQWPTSITEVFGFD